MKRPKWTRRWVLLRWWWQLVAPGLMSENRHWERIYESLEEERDRLEDLTIKLKKERHKQETFYTYIQEGYWRVTPTCAYRIDKKFIEWYSKWVEPVQMELELEYTAPDYEIGSIEGEYREGLPTEEGKIYDPIYGGEIPPNRRAV